MNLASLGDMIDRLQQSLARVGVWGTVRLIVRKLVGRVTARLIDQLLNITTERHIELNEPAAGTLRTIDDDVDQLVHYEPTSFLGFRRMVGTLPITYSDFVFVDIGCGLGRVLINAATYPFRRVVGVEVSTSMAQTARRNVEQARLLRFRTTIAVRCDDARNLTYEEDGYVIFMFNPFGESVMRDIVSSMEDAVRERNVKFFVVYYNNEQAGVFHRSGMFREIDRGTIDDWSAPRGYGYLVFESSRAPDGEDSRP